MKEKYPQTEWHSLDTKEVVEILNTDPQKGLSVKEAEKRINSHGRNIITPQEKQKPIKRFLLQFNQSLVYILLASTIVTLFLGEYLDAAVIFGVVLVNAIVGFVQESKAVKAIEALAGSMSSKNIVIRDGNRAHLESTELVPGDLVFLQAGDKVPADMRIIKNKDLRIDESVLTGESVPVDKKLGVLDKETGLGDRKNMAFASTMVSFGQAEALVTLTGDQTEVGKISGFISDATDLETPLTKKIRKFSYLLLYIILGFAVLSVIVGLAYGEAFTEIFMASVALAVAAIPEGLPAAVTITLAIGVTKMARQKAIIRKLAAVETLGSTSIICSDKTGTLTENQMTVQNIFAGKQGYSLTGLGYSPEGKILQDSVNADITKAKALDEVIKCGMLCNDSIITQKKNQWQVKGDPTEGAMIVAGLKAGYSCEIINSEYQRIDVVPFESEYMYMATLHKAGEVNRCYIKGSVEVLLKRCSKILLNDGSVENLDSKRIEDIIVEMASDGLRVLAFGYKDFENSKKSIDHEDLDEEIIFLGLQGMIDPPRKEAIKAVELCRHAGIQVKMITGDHALTASTIAGQLGLKGELKDGKLLARTGAELEKLSGEEFDKAAMGTGVFARVSPEQKLRLVKSLQKQNNIVAMTGDGVNDAPALKQANIGIAMGITGTEVAKEAADMVLTDDNFRSIERAVEEGRGVFDNLVKFIVWILPTNIGQGLVILVSVLLGTTLYVLPVQALWVNMTTGILLGLTLAFEPKEPGIMDRKPRDPDEPIMTKYVISRTLLVSVILVVASIFLFYYELGNNAGIDEARTVVTCVFVIIQSAYLFNCRSLSKPLGKIGFFSNPWIFLGIGTMLLLQILFVYVPFMNSAFHTVPISLMSWLRIGIAAIAVYIIIEIEKRIVQKSSK